MDRVEDAGTTGAEDKKTMGIPALLQQLAGDFTRLVRQQIQLATHEVQLETHRLVHILILLIVLVLIGLSAMLVTAFAIAATLHEVVGWPLWASCACVAAVLLLAAVMLLLRIQSQIESFHMLPSRTLHVLKEDVSWIKEQLRFWKM